jgi:hypothetical protein
VVIGAVVVVVACVVLVDWPAVDDVVGATVVDVTPASIPHAAVMRASTASRARKTLLIALRRIWPTIRVTGSFSSM